MENTFDLRPAEAAAREAQMLADAYVIDSPEMADAAGDDLKKLSAEYKRVEEMRFSITRPLDEAKKQAIASFKPYLDKIKAADDCIRGELNRWLLEERRRQQEEEARAAREEAERQAKLEEERRAAELAFDEATAAGSMEEAEAALAKVDELHEQEEMAMVAPAQNVVAAKKVGGISQRSTYKVKSIDLSELVKAAAANPDLLVYLQPNKVQINKEVRAMRERFKVPGIATEEAFGLSVRS